MSTKGTPVAASCFSFWQKTFGWATTTGWGILTASLGVREFGGRDWEKRQAWNWIKDDLQRLEWVHNEDERGDTGKCLLPTGQNVSTFCLHYCFFEEGLKEAPGRGVAPATQQLLFSPLWLNFGQSSVCGGKARGEVSEVNVVERMPFPMDILLLASIF